MTLQTQLVLRVMLDEPTTAKYGFELAASSGLKTGTLYPILIRLEEAGWLTSSWEDIDPSAAARPARRYYTLTAGGRRDAAAVLEESVARLMPGATAKTV
jgi:DNA-binding PadR family transcriptional regulator